MKLLINFLCIAILTGCMDKSIEICTPGIDGVTRTIPVLFQADTLTQIVDETYIADNTFCLKFHNEIINRQTVCSAYVEEVDLLGSKMLVLLPCDENVNFEHDKLVAGYQPIKYDTLQDTALKIIKNADIDSIKLLIYPELKILQDSLRALDSIDN